MDVIDLPLAQIIPYARNPRRNEGAVARVAAPIAEFGWRQPIVVDEQRIVLVGHTRLEAARRLGLETAPVHVAKGLTEAQARACRLMDNRSGENTEWEEALLGLERGDVAIERWQAETGKGAILDGDGRSFAEVEAERLGETSAVSETA